MVTKKFDGRSRSILRAALHNAVAKKVVRGYGLYKLSTILVCRLHFGFLSCVFEACARVMVVLCVYVSTLAAIYCRGEF